MNKRPYPDPEKGSSPSYGDVVLHTVDDKIPLYFWVGAELRFLECSKGRN